MQVASIVGAGLIGRAWAHVFARAGWQVRVWDPSREQRDGAAQSIARSLHDLAAHGLVADPAAAAKRVSVHATLAEALQGAGYVQESGPETLEARPPQRCWLRPRRRSSPRASRRSSPAARAASSRIR